MNTKNSEFVSRFTRGWRIEEIMHFPEPMVASDMRVIGRYQQGNFSFGKVQTAAQNINLERDLVAYDTIDSTLAYVCKQGQDH